MEIRTARPDEFQALADLGERLWRSTYTGLLPQEDLEVHLAAAFGPRQQASELADPEARTLVLKVAGTLRGYTLLQAAPAPPFQGEPRPARPLQVKRFYVDPDLHGSGAAQQLMAAAAATAAALGHDGLWLQVWTRNPRAIRFYGKVGFRVGGPASYQVGRRIECDHLMVRTF